MTAAARLFGSPPPHAGDVLQAQYFRDLLTEELAVACGDLAVFRMRLSRCIDNGDTDGASRLRREVKAREVRQREIEELVTAIDRRFAADRPAHAKTVAGSV